MWVCAYDFPVVAGDALGKEAFGGGGEVGEDVSSSGACEAACGDLSAFEDDFDLECVACRRNPPGTIPGVRET